MLAGERHTLNAPAPSFDVAIIGAGHNGLVTAAYLAQAGLTVGVFERRPVVGGAAVTEEFFPGFRNSVASYAVGLLNPKVVTDLDLKRHGLEIVERPAGNFLPVDDGSESLLTHSDPQLMEAEVARFSTRDAAALAEYEATLGRLADVLRALVLETPPNIGGGLRDLWQAWRTSAGARALSRDDQEALVDIFTLSAADYLDRWFENPALKGLLAFDGIVGTYASPYHPGTAYVLLHHCFGEIMPRPGAWGHAIGGMGAITQAMAKPAEEAGAVIEVDAAVAQVTVEGGRATGVALSDGRKIKARAVAANVNPKLLFTQLVDGEAQPPAFRRRMEHWKCASGVLRLNVALKELPDFTCRPGTELAPHHTAGINIGPSMDYLHRAYEDARELGWSREPVVEVLIPSTIDDSLAPPGQHVASLFCQYFAPQLPDGRSWDDARAAAADAAIAAVTRFAPNFKEAILGRKTLTPLDLERDFGLTGGDIFHGALDLNQLWSLRPALGHADYRMPVTGLYLCGSGAHPGGGVTGAPGHNAAREMIRDLT